MKIGELKNYRLIEKIGWGGMGVVYIAEDLALSRPVAIKFLPPLLVQDQEIMNRFRSEARSQARLTHPNITMVYAFQESEEQAFLVLEYVDGETLENRLKRLGRLSVGESVEIFGKVLSAMEYAHSKGIVHRDIKPSNIGLTAEGVVKVMDFGIALNIEESCRLTKTGHIMGSPHYMAPEQILGRHSDHRTDIYALGITLFEMLTGRPPFECPSDYEIRVAQVNEPPPSFPSLGYKDIPPALEHVIHKALAKAPEGRFQSAQEFRNALDELVDEGTSFPCQLSVPMDKATRPLPMTTASLVWPEAPPSQVSPRPWRFTAASILPWISIALVIVVIVPLLYLAFKGGARSPELRPNSFSSQVSQPPRTGTSGPDSPKSTEPGAGKPSKGSTVATAGKPGELVGPGLTPATAPDPKGQAAAGRPVEQVASMPPALKNEPAGQSPGAPPPTTPVVTAKESDKILPSEKPQDTLVLQTIKNKLKANGFSHVQIFLNTQNQIIVSGWVKSQAEKKRVIQLVHGAGYAGQINSNNLTIKEKAQKTSKKQIKPSRPSGGGEEGAAPPGQSALPPAFD